MEIIDLIIFLAVGALVGWLAGLIVKGRGFGLIGNVIVGIVGAILGGCIRLARNHHRWTGRLYYYGHHWRDSSVIYNPTY